MILTRKGSHRIATFTCELCGKDSSKTYIKKSFISICKRCIVGSYQFATKATTLHKGKYSYTTVEYTHSLQKVDIICPNHGVFSQTPSMHLQGQGCPTCGIEDTNKSKVLSTKTYVQRATNKFGNVFVYTDTIYTGARNSIQVVCRKHGMFTTISMEHLKSDTGQCPKCNPKYRDTASFIAASTKIHKSKYSYPQTAYKNARSSVIVTCSIHGNFSINSAQHLSGGGCISCAKYGFDHSIPGKLYYIYLPKYNLYKIGITNLSVTKRFTKSELKEIIVLWEIEISLGFLTKALEHAILKKYSKYKYTGKSILNSGNTELFTQDIFNIDEYSIPQLTNIAEVL